LPWCDRIALLPHSRNLSFPSYVSFRRSDSDCSSSLPRTPTLSPSPGIHCRRPAIPRRWLAMAKSPMADELNLLGLAARREGALEECLCRCAPPALLRGHGPLASSAVVRHWRRRRCRTAREERGGTLEPATERAREEHWSPGGGGKPASQPAQAAAATASQQACPGGGSSSLPAQGTCCRCVCVKSD
jgi:hypothetical protein